MRNSKKSILWGIVIGILLSFFYFTYFAPRYETRETPAITIKIDKWTGKSWRLVENNWKEMSNMDENWALIDKTLYEAININLPEAKVDSSAALKKLRERYPILKDIPDYDLLERIKLVYSKKMLVNMYLGDFLITDKTKEQKDNQTE